MAADSYRPVTTLARGEPASGPPGRPGGGRPGEPGGGPAGRGAGGGLDQRGDPDQRGGPDRHRVRDESDKQGEPPTVADLPAVGDQRGELVLAREIRAREMVAGRTPAQIAAVIRAECLPGFCTTWIRAHRLALGIALADVVAQVGPGTWPRAARRRGSARRCCRPTRAARSGPGPSTCTTCAPCTARSRLTWATTARACAAARTVTPRWPGRQRGSRPPAHPGSRRGRCRRLAGRRARAQLVRPGWRTRPERLGDREPRGPLGRWVRLA